MLKQTVVLLGRQGGENFILDGRLNCLRHGRISSVSWSRV